MATCSGYGLVQRPKCIVGKSRCPNKTVATCNELTVSNDTGGSRNDVLGVDHLTRRINYILKHINLIFLLLFRISSFITF